MPNLPIISNTLQFDTNNLLKYSHSPVGHFDNIVSELHALEGHGLPLHTCAGAINKSLEHKENTNIQYLNCLAWHGPNRPTVLNTTHPVLVDNIYNSNQLACVGSKREVGNTANLDEALEHLTNTQDNSYLDRFRWFRRNVAGRRIQRIHKKGLC